MDEEKIYLLRCDKCGNYQQLSIYSEYPSGSRRCVYCNKYFQINRFTIIKRVR